MFVAIWLKCFLAFPPSFFICYFKAMSAPASSDKVMTDIAAIDAMCIQQARDLECARTLDAQMNPGRTGFVRLVPADIGLPPLPAGVDEVAADIELPRGIILAGCGRLFQPTLPAGYQLANCHTPLAPDAKSYHLTVAGHAIVVMLAKKRFVIRRSPPPVAECRNCINPQGELAVGFGDSLTGAWLTVLKILGPGEGGSH